MNLLFTEQWQFTLCIFSFQILWAFSVCIECQLSTIISQKRSV